jgi:hypothetical protein
MYIHETKWEKEVEIKCKNPNSETDHASVICIL